MPCVAKWSPTDYNVCRGTCAVAVIDFNYNIFIISASSMGYKYISVRIDESVILS